MIDSVVCGMNGSIFAVSATGTSSMSDSLIACQPRMLTAVKAESVLEAFERQFADRAGGMLPQPGKSMKRRSTNSTFFSLQSFSTSAGDIGDLLMMVRSVCR